MQRWFLLHVNRLMPVVLLALSSTAYVGCEPPPVAEKKQEPKPTAQAKASQPQFAPRGHAEAVFELDRISLDGPLQINFRIPEKFVRME